MQDKDKKDSIPTTKSTPNDFTLSVTQAKQPYNTNRHMKYAPFWWDEQTNTLSIQREWQHLLNHFICPAIIKVVDDIKVPHIDQSKVPVIGKFMRFIVGQFRYDVVYQWFTASFQHHKLLSAFFPPSPIIIELTERDTKIISELSTKYLVRDPQRSDVHENDFSVAFRNAFALALTTTKEKGTETDNKEQQQQQTGVFLKTTLKSCKNDFSLRPVKDFVEAILMVSESRDMAIDLTVSNKMVVLPWNSKINGSNEARVICLNRKTVAISPQNMIATGHVLFQETKLQHKYIVNQLIELSNIVAAAFYYPDIVLDVYYDDESQHWKLIEINPGGVWSSSGSASFDWLALLSSSTKTVKVQGFVAS